MACLREDSDGGPVAKELIVADCRGIAVNINPDRRSAVSVGVEIIVKDVVIDDEGCRRKGGDPLMAAVGDIVP